MSFILDALKKSEADRQQNGATEFSGVPARAKSTVVPRWLWVVGVLLVINLAFLVGLLLRPDAPIITPPLSKTAETAVVNTNHATANFQDQVAAVRRDLPEQQIATDTKPSRAPAFEPPDVITQAPASVQTESLYPTIHQVRARGGDGIPELHLDIHVYSAQPDGRFVFINMSKLREGETLPQGLVVHEITPDGVVLDSRGQLFLLPRE